MSEGNKFSLEDIEFIKNAIRIFSQKWTTELAILLVSKDEPIGFNEIMRELDGISAAVLSDRLKRLQKGGYLLREVRAGPPTRTKYSLTSRGRAFAETMHVIVKHREL